MSRTSIIYLLNMYCIINNPLVHHSMPSGIVQVSLKIANVIPIYDHSDKMFTQITDQFLLHRFYKILE